MHDSTSHSRDVSPEVVPPPSTNSCRAGRTEGLLLLALAGVLGLTLRFYGLGEPTLWLDEMITAWVIAPADPQESWVRATQYAVTPPGAFLATGLVTRVLGTSEWALRLFPALADTLAAGLLGLLAWRWLGPRASGYAVLAYAVHTSVVYHARMARPYGVAMFLAMLATLLLVVALRRPRRWERWLAYACSVSALLWTQYVFVALLPAHAAWAVGTRGRVVTDDGEANPQPSRRTVGTAWFASVALAGLTLIPLLPQLQRLVQVRSDLEWGAAEVSADRFAELLWPGATLLAASVAAGAILLTPTGTCSFGCPERAGRPGFAAVLTWYGVPLLASYALARTLSPTLWETRYLIVQALPACLLLGTMASWLRPVGLRLAVAALFIGSTPFPAQVRELATQGYATLVTYDYRPALETLRTAAKPNDLVLVRTGMIEGTLLDAQPDDPRLHAYLASPLESFYLESPPRYRAIAKHMDEASLARHLDQALAATARAGGDVWLLLHDPGASGGPLLAVVDRFLRSRGWRLVRHDDAGAELLARYTRNPS